MAQIYFDKISKLVVQGFNYDLTKYNCTFQGIKRGDLVHFNKDGKEDYNFYRNTDLFIWNGANLQYLDSSIDDYGSVPKDFKVGEDFKPTHWIRAVSHNTIIHLDEELYKTIAHEFKKTDGMYKCNVVIQDKPYIIHLTNMNEGKLEEDETDEVETDEEYEDRMQEFISDYIWMKFPYLTVNESDNSILELDYSGY